MRRVLRPKAAICSLRPLYGRSYWSARLSIRHMRLTLLV